jgi:alginate O-acetyltransferase complex protein AlgI
MIFASFEFLFLFLPLFSLAYALAPKGGRNLVILGFSWAFYAWWRVDFLALLLGVTAFTFFVARAMAAAGPLSPPGRRLMALGVAGNLAVLGYFKYANFGVDSFNDVMRAFGGTPVAWTDIVLPVGLSFYILQSVSYLVDIRRGDIRPSRSFLDYAAYKALYSQLIAGPIVRYADIAEELRERTGTLRDFGAGARIFMIGFAMKVVLADSISPVVDAAFAVPRPPAGDAWIGAASYTLQLYFDFAGYSLMAIGLARMIGFHFPRNFDNPYLARNIQVFWQRWHMTLSRFLRDYLYISLGGNRRGVRRTYVNLVAVMAIGGFWHGASWNFLIWGLWHGTLLAIHRAWTTGSGSPPRPSEGDRRLGPGRRRPQVPWLLGHAVTLLCVAIGWVIFRAHDLGNAMGMYAGMLGLHGGGVSDDLAWHLTPDRAWMLMIAAGFVYLPLALAALHRAHRLPRTTDPGAAGALARVWWLAWPLAAFLLAVVLLYSRAAVPFLYFQF